MTKKTLFSKTKFQEKKQVKNAILENFDQKNCVFSASALPSKLVNIGAKGAFWKTLGSVSPQMDVSNSTKVGTFGSAGGRGYLDAVSVAEPSWSLIGCSCWRITRGGLLKWVAAGIALRIGGSTEQQKTKMIEITKKEFQHNYLLNILDPNRSTWGKK